MHHAIASSVLNTNIPITMPDTFNKVENTPQMNKLLVSLAAWKIEPDVDNIICIPTDIDNIWNTGTVVFGPHCQFAGRADFNAALIDRVLHFRRQR